MEVHSAKNICCIMELSRPPSELCFAVFLSVIKWGFAIFEQVTKPFVMIGLEHIPFIYLQCDNEAAIKLMLNYTTHELQTFYILNAKV